MLNSGDRLASYRLDDLVVTHPRPVWRAVDTRDERPVRLTLLPHLDDPDTRKRLERDLACLRQAAHPAIVTYDSIERGEGVHFVCCSEIPGTSLAELVPDGGFDRAKLLACARSLTDALGAAHGAGVTHRELTPDVVGMVAGGGLRVHGFGLSDVPEGGDDPSADPGEAPTLTLTREGSRHDLPFLAPEQVRGLPLDRATDVYSAGALLYWMATGAHPFEGEFPADLYVAVLRDPPRPLDQVRSDLPEAFASLVTRCMAKARGQRFADGIELHAALCEIA